MKFKKQENELIWERYTSPKIIKESDEDINQLISIFQSAYNEIDPYPIIGKQLKNLGASYEDVDVIKTALQYSGLDLDLDAILEQLGIGGENNTWEHDDLYGSEEEEGRMKIVAFKPEMEMEIEEHEPCNEVIYSDVKKLAEYSKRMLDICKETELEPWMQAKLVKASDYVSDVWHRIDGKADFANSGFEQSEEIEF